MKNLKLYQLKECNSKICFHSRPKIKDIVKMKLFGINCFLTLLHNKENLTEIKDKCISNDILWYSIELENAKISYFSNNKIIEIIINGILKIYKKLKYEEIILFVHCSAGYHRSGMIVYCILRLFDETYEYSLKILDFIRNDVNNNIGIERISFCERNIVPLLIHYKNINFLDD